MTRLSDRYSVRRLTQEDIPDILRLCRGNPLYYQHCPPEVSRQSIAADMSALPPRTTPEDKYYLGFFDGGELAAVIDLILNFPDSQTAFIGFFMMSADRQGRGAGSALIREICRCLGEKFSFIRLGYSENNPQSRHFWTKNGFEPTGVVAHTDDYDIVVMQKSLRK